MTINYEIQALLLVKYSEKKTRILIKSFSTHNEIAGDSLCVTGT